MRSEIHALIPVDGGVDVPKEMAEQWAKAIVTDRRSPKRNITLRIDPDIIDWFKAKGKGYQTRMNAVLRAYIGLQTSFGAWKESDHPELARGAGPFVRRLRKSTRTKRQG